MSGPSTPGFTDCKHPPLGSRSRGFLSDATTTLRFIWHHPMNERRRLRAAVGAIVFQARGRLLHRPSIVRIGERSRMRVHAARAESALAYANPLEWREIQVWRQRLKPGDLFVDVGANIGSYTLWAIELGATVIAVEPDHSSAATLRENLALNGYEAEVVEAALADAPGTAQFTTGLRSMNHLVVADERGAPGGRTVQVRTLDEILGTRVAAGVKVDVEGAESLVIKGAAKALTERRIQLMQLEWNSCSETLLGERREAAAAALESFGYELCRPNDDGVLIPVRTPGAGWDVFARPISSS